MKLINIMAADLLLEFGIMLHKNYYKGCVEFNENKSMLCEY